MREIELETVTRQRSRSRYRVAMAALVGVLVLASVVGIVVSVGPGGPATIGEWLYGQPTPTETIAPGGAIVYYEHAAPWGTLKVDNRTVQIGATPKSDFLARGKHMLVYQADPFPTVHCTISTPAAPSDTCPLDAAFKDRYGQKVIGNRAVELGSTLERLSQSQRDSLLAAIRPVVEYTSPVTTVRVGEHYAGVRDGVITLESATQPLTATVRVRMQDRQDPTQSGSSDTPFGSANCQPLCLQEMSPNELSPFPDQFQMHVHLELGYHYTAPNGSAVLDIAPLGQAQQKGWSPDTFTTVLVRWTGRWQVMSIKDIPGSSLNAANLPCDYGSSDLSFWLSNEKSGSYGVLSERAAANPADGCLLIARQMVGAEPSSATVYFLDRFGVLLAVGATAHAVIPAIPVANQSEMDEANALAA